MAAKGTAGKSASGASMSKYDMEVEERLQVIRKKAHPMPTGATQKKVDHRHMKHHDGGSTDDHLKIRLIKSLHG